MIDPQREEGKPARVRVGREIKKGTNTQSMVILGRAGNN